MLKKQLRRFVAAVLSSVIVSVAYAGTDIKGVVTTIKVKPGAGQLWFTIAPMYGANISLYCLAEWSGVTMFVPTSDPEFPYYYGLLLASMTKNLPIYIGNISYYSNSTACDVTKTGYGFTLLNQ